MAPGGKGEAAGSSLAVSAMRDSVRWVLEDNEDASDSLGARSRAINRASVA